jgi:hypothetical protein
VLDGVYRRSAEGSPEFVEAPAATDEALQAMLQKIITRTMKLLTRRGVLAEEEGSTYMADGDSDSDAARVLRPLQAAAWPRVYLPHRLRPTRRPEGADAAGRDARGDGLQADAVRRPQRLQPDGLYRRLAFGRHMAPSAPARTTLHPVQSLPALRW